MDVVAANRPVVAHGKPGNAADVDDMRRMNRPQELNVGSALPEKVFQKQPANFLKRLYSVVTLVGYAAIVGLTWPFALVTGTLALTNGGPAGAIWVFLAVAVGMFTVVLSMAEMASLEPTAGGQYHWVSVFAPKKYRKMLSYLVGWLCALGWQSYVPGAGNICGSAIQGFAVVANSSYVPKTWQLVLLTIFICSFAILFNIFLARRLPGIEAAVFTLYALAFIAFFIVLLAMGPRSSGKEIFTDFQDNAGWGSIGTACFVGVSGPVITLIGADSSVHMAEELKDASRQLPKAMISTAVVNYILGFLMTVAFIAVVGNVEEILASPTGLPYVQVIYNATLSRAATLAMVAFIILFFIFCAVNQNTTSSRQLYAFARDGGLPFSGWVSYVSIYRSSVEEILTSAPSKVSPTLNIPINAVIISWVIACGLACVPLGSVAAFLNIQTIGNAGLLVSYIICISCRLHHRNTVGPYGTLSRPPPFWLGKRGGNIINTIAICFLFVFVVSDMFPPAPHPTPETMNWSSLALGGTIIVALACYIWLRKTYLGAGVGNARVEMVNMDVESEIKSFDKRL